MYAQEILTTWIGHLNLIKCPPHFTHVTVAISCVFILCVEAKSTAYIIYMLATCTIGKIESAYKPSGPSDQHLFLVSVA